MKTKVYSGYGDFVVFLAVDFDDFFRRHLIKALAEQLQDRSKVLCVNRPICLVVTTIKHRKKMIGWLKRLFHEDGSLRKLSDNLYFYTPFVFLHDQLAPKIPFLRKANRWILSYQLRNVIKKVGLNKDYLFTWIFNPYQVDYMNLLNQKYLIYDCYDEFLAPTNFKNIAKLRWMEENEERILRKADIVLAASEPIANSRKKWNENIYVLPNAADIEHFALANAEHTEIPIEMRRIPKPIIGYVGTINERTDFHLVLDIAIHRPNWSIVFVGSYVPTSRDFFRNDLFIRARQQNNIYFLGPRLYDAVPSYIKAFDVCLIPYLNSEFNQNCSPIKLYEYLATGKPIISTDIAQVRCFSKVVSIAHSYEEFVLNIEDALREDNEELARRRYQSVLEHSWDNRASEILKIIDFFRSR